MDVPTKEERHPEGSIEYQSRLRRDILIHRPVHCRQGLHPQQPARKSEPELPFTSNITCDEGVLKKTWKYRIDGRRQGGARSSAWVIDSHETSNGLKSYGEHPIFRKG
jgi:hypothetical protein